jgi:diguanylate cyclase (GGDEF)-like protein
LGLAKLCGITDPNELKAIETGSLLHDIGKLAIDDYILNKPGRLSKREFEKMKMHATAGDEILQQVQFPFPVAKYVRYHHERWDGTGYPDGLKGEEIPIGSRILAIADAFDAIRSTRPYKSAFGIDDSIELLRAQAGSNYDARLIGLFISHIDELEAAADEAAKNISELSFRKYFESIDSAAASSDTFPSDQAPSAKASEELVGLLEFCSGVGRSLGLADVLPIVGRRLKQIVPYDACAFFTYQDDDSVRAEYACGELGASMQGIRIGLGKGISGWVAAYKRPMLNTGPALDLQGLKGDFTLLQDALVVPLMQEGECHGTISLYAREPLVYSQTHLSLLQTVAEQVALLVRDTLVAGKTEHESLIDPVTGTYRVAYLSVAGTPLLAHATNAQTPLSLVHIEIKNFSHNVLLYGQGTGDSILRKVADTLRAELRQTDILVRFGHDGFVALLPGVRGLQAARYVYRVQQQIKTTPINVTPGNPLFVGCQAGIASYPDDGSNLPALLQAAQRVLTENARLASPQSSGLEGNVLEFPPRT